MFSPKITLQSYEYDILLCMVMMGCQGVAIAQTRPPDERHI